MQRPFRPAPGLLAGLVLLASGCGWSGVSFPGAQPPAPEGQSADAAPGMDHVVRYDVSCQKCEVAYTDGSDLKVTEVEGMWSTRVRLEYPTVQHVTLRAFPTAPAGYVRRLRIYIDGKLAAEEERFGRGQDRDEVLISATLPTTPGRAGVVRIR